MIADPYRDFDRWDDEQYEALQKLPRCDRCDEPIQDEYLWVIDDEVLCEDCAEVQYKRPTDYFIQYMGGRE